MPLSMRSFQLKERQSYLKPNISSTLRCPSILACYLSTQSMLFLTTDKTNKQTYRAAQPTLMDLINAPVRKDRFIC